MPLALLVMLHLGSLTLAADPVVWDFEAGLPAGAVATGAVALQGELVRSGAQAVRVGQGGSLLLPVSPTDGFGTVRLWVHDPAEPLPAEQAATRLFGPLWGLANSANQQLCFGLLFAPYLAGNTSYGWISTAENGWGSRRHARANRSPGWHEWVITVNNETDLKVTMDGRAVTGFDTMTSRFFRGFHGVYLRGPVELDGPLVVDDIAVAWQAAPLTARPQPLPGEKRQPPEAPPLALRRELFGQHPRLFFTAAEVPGIRARCETTHAGFAERLLSGADSYLQVTPPTEAAQCANDQVMQQWGWWRLQTLAFAYVVSGDERYGRQALRWMDIFAAYPDWGAGEEVNQSMGAANMLTGMACAYDWVHDLMTEAQRETFREKLARQVAELAWAGFLDTRAGGYWKADHQNNHRHHRLSGLALGALVLGGEVPEAEAYAAFAAEDLRQVAAALPPDGTNHEGPNYTAFGLSYVVRAMDAMAHCSDLDLFDTPGLAAAPYFRAHMLAPGFQSVFNFGDGGTSTYYFNHYLFRLAAAAADPAAQALTLAAWEASPGSFGYFPWPILWYDASLEPAPLETIPTWHYFDDLEIASYRTNWTDPAALALFFKCGPYGGHRLNQLRDGNAWVNIAHDHPDANHFMLHWGGIRWATDDGYPKRDKAGRHHNLVLIDGEGPRQRGGGWLQPIPGMAEMGRIDHVACADGLFAVRGDATGYYPQMAAVHRWLAAVDDELVVVVDRLAGDQPRQYDWLLHTAAEVSGEPAAYRLSQDGQELHLRFANPASLVGAVTTDILEEKERGRLITVSASQRQAEVWLVAVLARSAPPEPVAETTPSGLTVRVGGRALAFDADSGQVSRLP